MAQVKPEFETIAKIKVIGVGGGGNNAVSRMVSCKIQGVDFIAVNADSQQLHQCQAPQKLLIGKNTSKGLGAGMNPEIGRQAAEENKEDIQNLVKGADLVFVTYGLGGGVGTGAGPIVAEVAKDAGALTVGVVTKPFDFEGFQRMKIAEDGLAQLKERVDALIVVPNDKLFQIIETKTSIEEAFRIVDDILRQGVQGISDLIVTPGLINPDFADVKAIMKEAGSALIGIGRASGDDRAVSAAKMAINSPLLEVSIDGARGVLFNVTGGHDLSMLEINEAAKIVTESIDAQAKVIFGAVIDEKMKKGEMKITVIATGFNGGSPQKKKEEATKSTDFFRSASPNLSGSAEPASFKSNEPIMAGVKSEFILNKPKSAVNGNNTINSSGFNGKINQIQEEDDDLEIPTFIRKKMK